jgi:3-hydroxyisobutyrate dehydrogenase
MEKIGFIGLGNMGRPLAERLLKKYQLYVYDLEEENLNFFVSHGAIKCLSPSEIASKTDRVFLCLPTSSIVEKVINGDKGIFKTAKQNSFIIDMTTGEPEITRELSKNLLLRLGPARKVKLS